MEICLYGRQMSAIGAKRTMGIGLRFGGPAELPTQIPHKLLAIIHPHKKREANALDLLDSRVGSTVSEKLNLKRPCAALGRNHRSTHLSRF
jgi:hypothetical protein